MCLFDSTTVTDIGLAIKVNNLYFRPMRTLILLIALLTCTGSYSQNLDELSNAQWVNDLDDLTQAIKAHHAKPYNSLNGEYFNNRIDNLSYRMGELSTAEKLLEFIKLSAAIGDGHTTVQSLEYFKLYPIIPFWFDNELRAVWTSAEYKEVAGWKITAINNKPLNEVSQALADLIPKNENDYYKMHWNQYWLRNANALHAAGITESDASATFTFEKNGEKRTIALQSLPQEAYEQTTWVSGYRKVPKFLMRKNEPIWFDNPDEYTLYMNWNYNPDDKTTKDIASALQDSLNAHSIVHLVIDLRSNRGASKGIAETFTKKIAKTDFADHGRIFIITGRETFGEAIEDINLFREEFEVVLVGEPPGQKPQSYADPYPITLTHSGLKASIATDWVEYQERVSQDFLMDQTILPNYELRDEGRDEVLEWIILQP